MEKDSKRAKSQRVQQQELDNEAKVLTCLRHCTTINSEFYQFQGFLYQKSLNLPRQIFKHFRNIRDIVETTFATLESYVSFNQEFIEEKDRILQEQILLTESQMSYSQVKTSSEEGFFRKRTDGDQSARKQRKVPEEQDSKQIEVLRGQIESLKNHLRQNDSEYQIQIKKYNMKYEEMMEEIKFYQEKMGLVDEYEETIEQLQVQIRVMKDIKERDDQLIRYLLRYQGTWLERSKTSNWKKPVAHLCSVLAEVRQAMHLHEGLALNYPQLIRGRCIEEMISLGLNY